MSDTGIRDDPHAEHEDARGPHLAAISRRMVELLKEHYGKGPTSARTYMSGDLVVVILNGGYTTSEKTLIREGHSDAVAGMRTAFQEAMRPRMKQIVEEEIRRPVIAFMSTNHQDPDLNAELFILASEDDEEQPAD